ncbi:hypothetical protein Bpfe_015674 [Biomphalaria pfeifferi]|uniref:Uncharacterized protein n=1 Tax=Biomphalaria pfeifferi TaxID=112525 RepID=A0AAD8F8R8_BIOPF|nr:hypothetical protein Bpfe_015674 [Biomphalaria pfeifferi]
MARHETWTHHTVFSLHVFEGSSGARRMAVHPWRYVPPYAKRHVRGTHRGYQNRCVRCAALIHPRQPQGENSIGLPFSRSNTAPYSTYHSFVGPFCAAGT